MNYVMQARDHECDIQGVVNNAAYQHYFEHARHAFLRDKGMAFDTLARQGIYLMVKKIEIAYLDSLVAHDEFYVTVSYERASRLLVAFNQCLYLKKNDRLMATAQTLVVTVDSQRKVLKTSPLQALC